jgi:hypothetical protein
LPGTAFRLSMRRDCTCYCRHQTSVPGRVPPSNDGSSEPGISLRPMRPTRETRRARPLIDSKTRRLPGRRRRRRSGRRSPASGKPAAPGQDTHR